LGWEGGRKGEGIPLLLHELLSFGIVRVELLDDGLSLICQQNDPAEFVLGSGGILSQKVNLHDVFPIWKFAQPDGLDELEVKEAHKNLLLGPDPKALNAHVKQELALAGIIGHEEPDLVLLGVVLNFWDLPRRLGVWRKHAHGPLAQLLRSQRGAILPPHLIVFEVVALRRDQLGLGGERVRSRLGAQILKEKEEEEKGRRKRKAIGAKQ